MTSNNETVSRQMPWARNIAKTMTSNGKQFTVTHEMLTAVARDRWNLSAVFKFCFCFVLLYNKSLNDWSLGEQWILFPETRETLRFEGNKIYCSSWDQSLSDLLYSKTKQTQNLKTALRFQRSRATAVNISRVTVNCFPFDVIVFAMLPAHGIWRETVSLLDVMWPWSSQWLGAL